MADELGEIAIKVSQEGTEDAMKDLEDSAADMDFGSDGGGGPGGDGAGAMLAGVVARLGAIGKILAGVLGAVLVIGGLLLGMEPIQEMLSALMSALQAFLIPLAMMLLQLFQPILRMMMELLPHWLEFWNDPIGGIMEALDNGLLKFIFPPLMWLEFLAKLFPDLFGDLNQQVNDVFSWLWNKIKNGITAIPDLPSRIWEFMQNLPEMIWDFIKELPELIVDGLASVIPGAEGLSGAASTARDTGSGIVSRGRQALGDTGRRLLDVNVSGYNDEEVKEVLSKSITRRGGGLIR